MSENAEPETIEAKPSRLKKYGPAIFWGSMIALPAMNLASAFANVKAAKINLAIETLKNETPQS